MSSTPKLSPIPQLSEAVLRDVDRHREDFLHAQPFKHMMIDGFLQPEFAERLLTEFPSFDVKLAKNESGGIGGKSVQTCRPEDPPRAAACC